MAAYLHSHRNFPDLLSTLEEETGIQAYLIEKDYWIMNVLNGLQRQQFSFELKGGTSLSKAFLIRLSEKILRDLFVLLVTTEGTFEKADN
jgi:hypothetical protein